MEIRQKTKSMHKEFAHNDFDHRIEIDLNYDSLQTSPSGGGIQIIQTEEDEFGADHTIMITIEKLELRLLVDELRKRGLV